MSQPTYCHLPADSCRPMPWRNGGGITYEIARHPADAAEFDWRLSLARIDRPGPFSEFRGYERAIALVSGEGCVLNGAAEGPIALDRPGAISIFAGEAAVDCALLGGPCHDLNLMVRRPIAINATRYLATDGEVASFAGTTSHLAVFCVSGALHCVREGGDSVALGPRDTLLVAPADAARWRFQPGLSGASTAIVFQWT